MVDFRYNWGHSNMAFNFDPTIDDIRYVRTGIGSDVPEGAYQENYEYTNNTISISLAYMFEYNTDFKRKGSSTSDESKKTKKDAKKKKED